MTSRIQLTLAVTLALTGAYFLYAFATNAVLRVSYSELLERQKASLPTASSEISTPDPFHSDSAQDMARRHLRNAEWASSAKIQLKGKERLFYYSQTWQQATDRKSFRFEPFALIWFTRPDEAPLVITADSALISFERPIEPSKPDPGRIMGGQLNGEVRVLGADNLDVTGTDFVFSETDARFWSDNPVTFAWMRHRGRSQRGIQIDLEIDPGSADASQMAVQGVKQVHLFRDVEMNFLFEQKNETIPIDVSAVGSFLLQLQSDTKQTIEEATATFDEQVTVRRWTSPSDSDVMLCDRLSMFLERPDDAALRRASGATASSADATAASNSIATVSAQEAVPGLLNTPGGTGLQFRRMRATGEVVRLVSDVNQLEATMQSLEYDVDERRVLLNDLDPGKLRPEARRQLPWVTIRQKDGQIRCRQVELTHETDGRLREVFCRGEGDLSLLARDDANAERSEVSGLGSAAGLRSIAAGAGPGRNVLEAQWTRQLRQYHDHRAAQDVIDLTGDAVVRMPGNSAVVAADYIKVWADPLQDQRSIASPRSGEKPPETKSEENEPVPRKILAQGRVTLVSPELQGQMDELQAWIEDAPAGSAPSDVPRRLDPVSLRVDEDAIQQVGVTEPALLSEKPGVKKNPVFVSSKLTRVLIKRFGAGLDPHVEEVWSEGSVEITHRRNDADEPMVLLADRLHVQNRSELDQVLHLFGRPARVADPQMNLIGEEIFFDRHRNLVWVDGSGTLKLPVTRDFDGNLLAEPSELGVNWIDQMVFDGREARFVGRVHGTILDSVMRCQKMTVTMSERVSFQEQSQSQKRPDVATVLCQYNVEFSSHKMENSALEEVRRARFAAFAFDNRSGRAEAQGPGYLSVWRRGQGKRAGLGPLGAAGANRGMQTQQTGWEYLRIDFARDMIGNVKKKSTVARGEVQVIYSPVDEPLAMVNLDRLPKDGGAISCDSLEFIQRTSVKDGHYIELLASGNASLEGQTFYGLADDISFDESKGLYMLKSYGENESTLWREKQRGAERTAVVARTFRYTPSTNSVMFDDASRVQGVQ